MDKKQKELANIASSFCNAFLHPQPEYESQFGMMDLESEEKEVEEKQQWAFKLIESVLKQTPETDDEHAHLVTHYFHKAAYFIAHHKRFFEEGENMEDLIDEVQDQVMEKIYSWFVGGKLLADEKDGKIGRCKFFLLALKKPNFIRHELWDENATAKEMLQDVQKIWLRFILTAFVKELRKRMGRK